MKTLILTIVLSLFASTSLNAQWEILNEGFKGWINSIDFVNENIGWIGEGEANLLKTTDGGETWNSIPVNENWNINQIDFLNDSVGWATATIYNSSGSWTIIIKTSNGGYSWLVQKQIADIWLNSIYIIDGNNLYAAGDNKIYKTLNGGLSWDDVSPNIQGSYYRSLWFQNPEYGVIVGDYCDSTGCQGIILRTTNGGSTWEQTITNEFSDITNLQFLDNTTGYFTAHSDTIYFLCKTEDMLKTWTVITQTSTNISSYKFLDSATVYTAMSNGWNENSIKKSTDGGVTWQNIQSFSFLLNKIYFNSSKVGFLLGGFGAGGRGGVYFPFLWKMSPESLNWEIKKFSYPVLDTYFINNNRGFLFGGAFIGHCGDRGDILSTNDGGKTWELKYSIGDSCIDGGTFTDCIFFDEFTGYCLAGGIYKTTDGGNNWAEIYEFYPDPFIDSFHGNDMYFRNEQIGWVVGSYEINTGETAILKTTDGGYTWDVLYNCPNTYNLHSIYFSDTTGWAVGESGMIVKCIQDEWVKTTPLTDLPLKKVFSIDDNVWISGGYMNDQNSFAIFLKSDDNGQTWIKNQAIPYLINDMYFIDSNLGLAVGADKANNGVILKSTNGGDTWEVIVDSLPGPLNSIFIKDNYGWAAGPYLVLRTTDAGTTWIDDRNNKTYPTEFELKQNYPNPFNPNTTLSFVIGHLSFVTLKIYDILGREIAILVSEEKPAGEYEVEFNANKFSSGIYFYSLKTENLPDGKAGHSAVKKMLLLK